MTTDSGSRGKGDLPGLAATAMSGDAAALQSLLAGVWPDAYHIACSILRDRQIAEDAAQEACAQAIVGLSSLRQPEAFRAWFFRFVTREVYKRLRQRARETPVEAMEEQPAPASESADVLDLRRAVRSLPLTYRLPVLLHYYFGLSDREVARAVGTTAGAVRVRLTVARRRLRRALREPPAQIVSPRVPGSESASH